ncbi:hypothetical protein ACHQM5_027149 [Ranunculus cassubicifolius]
MYLFQNQCCFHTCSTMLSMGTFFVSGRRNMTNNAIAMIHAAKKKNINAFIMLELTAKAKPIVLVSRGNVSLGINHPRGPHDHANAMTKTHTRNTIHNPSVLPIDPVAVKCSLRRIPIITCKNTTQVETKDLKK